MLNHLWRRLAAACLAVTIAASAIVGLSPAKTEAYNLSTWGWDDHSLTYCVNSGIGSHQEAQIHNAMDIWDAADFNMSLTDTVCLGANIQFKAEDKGDQYIAHGGCASLIQQWFTDYSGRTIQKCGTNSGEVIINTDWDQELYWLDGSQGGGCLASGSQSYSGPRCLGDGRTVLVHEIGHALGLDHVDYPDENCTGGYSSTSYITACNDVGERGMNWESGVEFVDGVGATDWISGYRHAALHGDDQSAVRAIYGP